MNDTGVAPFRRLCPVCKSDKYYAFDGYFSPEEGISCSVVSCSECGHTQPALLVIMTTFDFADRDWR